MPNKRGFTLIELMVVISIIAILSIIGITVFTGVQKNARDAARRGDIDAIVNALETNYDGSTGKYVVLAGTQFAAGTIPEDTFSGLGRCGSSGNRMCEYCGRAAAGTAMVKTENWTSGCTSNGAKVNSAAPASSVAYEVCATLETSPYFYCKSNQR